MAELAEDVLGDDHYLCVRTPRGTVEIIGSVVHLPGSDPVRLAPGPMSVMRALVKAQGLSFHGNGCCGYYLTAGPCMDSKCGSRAYANRCLTQTLCRLSSNADTGSPSEDPDSIRHS